jgi:predicted transcriptional regulator
MPRPGPRRRQVAVRLSAEQVAALDAEAERQDVDRSEVVRQAIDKFLGLEGR